ncbi:DUF2199 domain-containing protein [Pedobacter puniceum]|uniref:DUF2199 domain-containing protein n=1 Tax=Pedobacter puniceum TaxID=2666136 RepID=A0A7K0FNY5_9SPHI|nr:DUF2199 domain-containing protein [Pedobacter puniceum]MRX47125.1 DUF2199 domain-containing protein [Pedobacter puniceum]
MKYTCEKCGKVHEEWPALTYISPLAYDTLSDEEKKSIATLDSDFCVIKHPDQTDRFIRCVLFQEITDHCQDLQYGLWVSLSEKSFEDYSLNFNNDNYENKYFGWLSNDLLDYEFDESIPTTVYTNKDGNRPEIIPHKDFDHPFVKDFYNGITKAEAEKRIKHMIETTS